MEEIRRIAQRVTVLRDGHVVATRPTEQFSLEEIVQSMVGEEAVDSLDLGKRELGGVALRVAELSCGHRVRDVSFEVRSGEILGLAGLVGSGRTETLHAVFGADRPNSGRVFRGGNATPIRIDGRRDAVRAGIGMISEDRKQYGLLLSHPVRVNMTLARLGNLTQRRFWIDRKREQRAAVRLSEQLAVQGRSIEQPVFELSGGNQQKVFIARWLFRDCDVVLFDEPTRGIDVAAKYGVYRILGELAARGKAIVVVSSELRELMALCDRILVMSGGRAVRTFKRGEWTEDRILNAAFSEYAGRSTATIPDV